MSIINAVGRVVSGKKNEQAKDRFMGLSRH